MIDYNAIREAFRMAMASITLLPLNAVVEVFYHGPAPADRYLVYYIYNVRRSHQPDCNCHTCYALVTAYDSRLSSLDTGNLVTAMINFTDYTAPNGVRLRVMDYEQTEPIAIDELFTFSVRYKLMVTLP